MNITNIYNLLVRCMPIIEYFIYPVLALFVILLSLNIIHSIVDLKRY